MSRRRRRGDAPGWGATAMPNLRHNVVELLARVPQEVRTPQEKACLPTLTHATTMCGMMWACTDDGLTVWPVMKLPQSAPPSIMTGILDTTAPSTRPIEHYPPRWVGAMTLLGTTWILMTQDKVTTTQPQEVTTGRDAAIHRRRTQSPAHVHVINLRPTRHVPTDDTDQQTGRRYTTSGSCADTGDSNPSAPTTPNADQPR